MGGPHDKFADKARNKRGSNCEHGIRRTGRKNRFTNIGNVDPKVSNMAAKLHADNTESNKHRIAMAESLKDDMKKCIIFLGNILDKPHSEQSTLIEQFPFKEQLKILVDHLIAVGMGGWHRACTKTHKPILVNEYGHLANPEHWTLLPNRKLISKNGKVINMDVDKLLVLKECLNG